MRTILAAAVLGMAFGSFGVAGAADLGPAPVYATTAYVAPMEHTTRHWLPACETPAVLARIPERFAYYNARVIHSGLSIHHVGDVRETGVSPEEPGLISRRYCSATALLSDGSSNEVVFIIEGPKLGVASIGWHVESCLPGFDPYRVYDARCRSIRP